MKHRRMPRGEREKRTRRRRYARWATVVKYAILMLIGVWAFFALSSHAGRQRGYMAVGGEGVMLFLPAIYYPAEKTLRDLTSTLAEFWREY